NIPNLKTHKPIRYKVKAGDNLGRIAQRHHVKTSSIRAWNELKSDRIYAGQKLTIYVPMNQNIEVVKKAPKKVKKSTIKRGEYQEYTVKTGDTLWAISQLFESVTADMIMEDNGIDENIAPGQVLKIRKLK
ncbi:Membrane-bound lytic murein transglycosylase D precursor, partial [hydrothermal vent metagenome]